MNPVSKFTPKIRREKTALSNSDLSKKKQDTVQVFCRLRPLNDDEESSCIKLLSPTVLSLTTPAQSRAIRKEIQCTFKHIFTGYASQNEVFEHVAYPLLDNLLKGKNGLLFTYGVTGSGKTYTLTGNHANPGIMPKCIHTIFNSISEFQAPKYVIKPDRMNGFEIQSDGEVAQDKWNELKSTSKTPLRNKKVNKDKTYINDGIKIIDVNQNNLYSVFVSYNEIYNNIVYDLLDESKTLESKILREDSQKNMYVNGVVETEVKSAEEAFELFNIGQKRKRMGNTILNSVSSRSHSIFNIRVVQFQQVAHNDEGHQMIPDTNLLKVAQLSLVDLAGSERTNRTKNTGQLLKEASQINKSLMSLRTCLEVLRKNQMTNSNEPVPYRDSKLTLLLKNFFEGEGSVAMIVCVNPSVEDFEENLQVMNFAETTKNVQIAASESRYNTPHKKTICKRTATPNVCKSKGSFTFGPKLPKDIKINFSNPEESQIALENLASILKIRIQKTRDFSEQPENNFRKRLIEVEKENILINSDIKSVKTQLRKEKLKSTNVEAKLGDMEVYNRDLIGKNKELQNEIMSLRNIIAEKDLKINKNIVEKEKTEQKMALRAEKMTHELDAKLRRQREHLQAAMKAKENKIQKVREILDKELTPPDIEEKEPLQEYDPQQTPKQQPQQARRNGAATTPAVRRRRSRSAGDVWLEHNSVKPVPLGTVLQPSMKKRKSVTKLSKASDITNPKQSKYCLIAQEQDLEGELETKVYKGDILPTCGGGAQVIFNDVEKLRQESPTATK
ncbi:kinesin-like protein KIF23 [Asbolus verrucosus]|uniref:Kinesin-like protein n=1 Tax=Asbolus verrucosus TaxID=1661398 RepID=A0A482VJR2_ASBVE|nr:kinesin-like protein KIF23 [Asbolus verrucosus]